MINNMSVGKDYTLSYYDTDEARIVDLGDIQNFKITAQKADISSEPYNDVPRFGYIPDGYAFTFTITRTGSALEDFQLAANTRFNEGGNTHAGFINETIRNPDGTVSRYQYTGVVLWVGDLGDVTRKAAVKVGVEGRASDKKRIA